MQSAFVYHYTSIPTLALILKNRTIRFNSFRCVDDLQEIMSAEEKEYGKYCFVSCWTHEVRESIPMWKMYSDSMKGVRIGLPVFPFQQYDDGVGGKTYVPPPFDREDYFVFPADSDMFFSAIKYSDEPNDLLIKVEDPNGISFNPKSFSCKSKHWEFQKECRYKLFILPPLPNRENGIRINMQEYNSKIRMCPNLKIDHFDLSIKPDLFKQIEIITGPAIRPGSGEDVLVTTLATQYGISPPKRSCLLDKIRI